MKHPFEEKVYKQFIMRMTEEEMHELKTLSEYHCRTKSSMVRILIQKAIRQIPRDHR